MGEQKLQVSLRLREQHKDQARMAALLASLAQWDGACDELWFSSDYGFPELEVHQRHAEQMGEAAALARAQGLEASLQLSNTIGHDDAERALNHQGLRWQRMTGPDGTEACCSSCPRDPDFHAYLREMVSLYAAWKPKYVWADDDLRMANHFPVKQGCFCRRCLSEFSRETGRDWEREALAAELNHGNPEWRAAWVRFCRDSMAGVMRTACRAVMAVSPDSVVGFEHGGFDWCSYTGGDHEPVFRTILEETGRAPASRPGAGYYHDHAPRELLDKAYSLQLQNTRLPSYVTDIRPEIENFTHTAMGKSPYGTMLEASCYLACGCGHLSFATMMIDHEPLSYHEKMFRSMAQWRPFWQRYLELRGEARPSGLRIAYSRQHFLRRLGEGEADFAWAMKPFQGCLQLPAMGLALCFEERQDDALLLHPDAADGMDEAELRRIFAGGVVTDGETIHRLQARGLGYLTGVRATRLADNSVYERMSGSPRNGAFQGQLWMQYFYGEAIYALEAENPPEVLGDYVNGDGEPGGAATLLTETPAGGRLAVFGYPFWSPLVSSARRNQIFEAVDWVSGRTLPVRPEGFAQHVFFPCSLPDNRLQCVTVLNASIGPSPAAVVRLRHAAGRPYFVCPGQPETALETRTLQGEQVVSLPEMPPYGIGILYCKPDGDGAVVS